MVSTKGKGEEEVKRAATCWVLLSFGNFLRVEGGVRIFWDFPRTGEELRGSGSKLQHKPGA